MHGLLWFFGVYPVPSGTSAWYQLWSGFIPSLTVLTLLGTVVSLYHVHNCHEPSCWRLGKHKVNGSPWCNRHQLSAREAAEAVTAAAATAPDDDRWRQLTESIDGLASAVRAALLDRNTDTPARSSRARTAAKP